MNGTQENNHMLDNLAEYADPILFDSENADYKPMRLFFLGLARQCEGGVLEIGCGTGRFTIPLAEQGIAVTGLDIVPAMLARARQKSAGLSVEWVEADARDFQLAKQFGMIFMAGGTFHHFLERADQEGVLRCIKEHLTENGRFAFAAVLPKPKLLHTPEKIVETEWFNYTDELGREVRVSGTDSYDHLRQVKLETAYRRWQENGREVLLEAPLSLRYYFPQELEALLHYNGFTILETYGDWDKTPLTNESQSMIFVCGKAGEWSITNE
jgi:SAM-dependent methyltransferase